MKAIVVGSAASLLDKKAGSIIDSFDYVIRPVTCLLADGYEVYTGTKTDMYWVAYQYLARLSLIKIPADILCMFSNDDEYKEFYPLCSTVPPTFLEQRFSFDLFLEQNQNKIKSISFVENLLLSRANATMKFKHPYTAYDLQKGRVSANTGINVIYHVVNYMNFDQVYVTGFDFYKTGFYWCPDVLRITKRPFPYREMLWYKHLLQGGRIYEL